MHRRDVERGGAGRSASNWGTASYYRGATGGNKGELVALAIKRRNERRGTGSQFHGPKIYTRPGEPMYTGDPRGKGKWSRGRMPNIRGPRPAKLT